MQGEMDSLRKNQVWDLVDLPAQDRREQVGSQNSAQG
jgi:hypothetical protein